MPGYLKLITGPMYAGKSTELINNIRQYKFIGKEIMAINHIINKRYGSECIITHNGEKVISSINLSKLEEIIIKYNDILEKSDVIIIDEIQFFQDAFDIVISLVEKYNKIVICAGLMSDYKKQPFGDILKLIPHADDIVILSSICSICKDGTTGHFSKKISGCDKQTDVGSGDKYISVCRKHF
tara:strand:+ start:1161 stop:1709 length:549 start_codon:yes stop_codon:yes gene_type:complete